MRNVAIVELLTVFILAELRAIKAGSPSDSAACILPKVKILFLIVCHDHIFFLCYKLLIFFFLIIAEVIL